MKGLASRFTFSAKNTPLVDITKQAETTVPLGSKKTWKKLAREGRKDSISIDMDDQESHRPELELSDLKDTKKKCVIAVSGVNKENIQVVAGFQHHQA